MGKHSEWRKLAKKARRKRVRQEIAVARKHLQDDEQKRRESLPSYKIWLEEQQTIEEFKESEETRLAQEAEKLYLERERLAQEQWVELQKKLALAKEEQAKKIEKIKEEWDRQQKKLKELKEEKERKEEEKRKRQEKLQLRIEEFVNSNGDMPDELNQVLESNPGKMLCPFFKKTAACRFNDTCSRNHVRPTISRIVLIKNFYSHYSLEQTMENEHGSDSILEFENHEIYNHYKDFFYDVVPEMEKFGQVRQFKVCCNREGHLRGNVYVEYGNYRDAVKSYRAMMGRWYGGRQLNVEFCSIDSWKSAICGLFFRQKCPKGSVCNFLHVFRNPSNMFSNADKDLHRTPPPNDFERDENNSRNWRWSESPEQEIFEKHRISKKYRNGSTQENYSIKSKYREETDRSYQSNRRKRHKSRSKSRSRSHSRHRKSHKRSCRLNDE